MTGITIEKQDGGVFVVVEGDLNGRFEIKLDRPVRITASDGTILQVKDKEGVWLLTETLTGDLFSLHTRVQNSEIVILHRGVKWVLIAEQLQSEHESNTRKTLLHKLEQIDEKDETTAAADRRIAQAEATE